MSSIQETTTPDQSASRGPARDGQRRAAPRLATRKSGPDLAEFKAFLAGLAMAAEPSIHINGPLYHHALLVVDFGTPFKQTKLTPDQSAELVNRIRKLSRDLLGKEINVRVSNDSHAGIWWSSVS